MDGDKDKRLIQDILGEGLIELVKEITRNELETASSYEAGLFAHINDANARKALAQIMFETRWIYKLGLTLVVKDEEQTAHVRTQIFGYGAICEGVLADLFEEAKAKNALTGQCWRHHDPPTCSKPIRNPLTAGRKNFKQLNEISKEENWVIPALYSVLEALRIDRNTIHSKVLAAHSLTKFYIPKGSKYFQSVLDTVAACNAWKAAHP